MPLFLGSDCCIFYFSSANLGILEVRFTADAFDSRCAQAGVRRPDSQNEFAGGGEHAIWYLYMYMYIYM